MAMSRSARDLITLRTSPVSSGSRAEVGSSKNSILGFSANALADLDIAMVIVTHEMAFARDISDRVVFMAGGVIVEEGTPEQVFASDNERTQSFLGRYGALLN